MIPTRIHGPLSSFLGKKKTEKRVGFFSQNNLKGKEVNNHHFWLTKMSNIEKKSSIMRPFFCN